MMVETENMPCSDKKWRYCIIEAGFCKNCKQCYVEAGDILETTCTICNEKKRCRVDRVLHDGKTIATCKICNSAQVATEDLENQFIWCNDEKFHTILEQVLDLPRDDLRVVLMALHKRVER